MKQAQKLSSLMLITNLRRDLDDVGVSRLFLTLAKWGVDLIPQLVS